MTGGEKYSTRGIDIFSEKKRNILQRGEKLFEEEERNIFMLTCIQTYRKGGSGQGARSNHGGQPRMMMIF